MVEPNVKSPLLQGIVVILIAFVLALATYRLIELPVRRARGRPLVLATVCLMLTLCGIAGYMTSARFISPRQIPPEVERLMLPASDNAVKA
jgi:peptidoglycan/LPS O-acetylase OafA/YrhL